MIDSGDIERLKEIFVTRRDCDEITDDINRKLGNDSMKLAVIEQELKTISWVCKTTLGGVLTAIIGAVMMLVLK